MTPEIIMWLVNLGLVLPELAVKIQKLMLNPEPTQGDWDVIWTEVERTPEQIRAEARARLGLPPKTETLPPEILPFPGGPPTVP
jgi:hypothetical protein